MSEGTDPDRLIGTRNTPSQKNTLARLLSSSALLTTMSGDIFQQLVDYDFDNDEQFKVMICSISTLLL